MDETPMRFELPSSRTLEFSDSRTVTVKSCGAEKSSFTVTLAVAADGKKLPPSVISKVYALQETSLFKTLFEYRSSIVPQEGLDG